MPWRGLIPMATSDKSWTKAAKNAEVRRRCPPVEDCPPRNARTRQPSAKDRKKAAELAAQAKAARQAKKNKANTWPNKGKYEPNKGKARGKS